MNTKDIKKIKMEPRKYKKSGRPDDYDFAAAAKRSETEIAMLNIGAILSDTAIERGMREGSIVICPFNKDNLTNCAYDISLGARVVYVPDSPPVVDAGWLSNSKTIPTIDITDKDAVATSFRRLEISEDMKGVTIPPRGFAVCHSNEFIGTNFHPRTHITTMMRARSTLSRAGISISPSAGWGDVGFANRWGMIIHNGRSDASVFIPFGAKIAQIVFLRVSGSPSQSYASASGNYGAIGASKHSFEQLDAAWDVKSLLPHS